VSISDIINRHRQATGAVEDAKRREREAIAAAEEARTARLEAEKAVGPAAREAAKAQTELQREAEHRLGILRGALTSAQRLEVRIGDVRPSNVIRLGARIYLHGGVEGGQDSLTALAQRDHVLASFLDVARQSGQYMTWTAEAGAGTEYWNAGDDVEIAAWDAAMNRCYVLAGERPR
jgi:hypothetical protein